MQPAPTITFIIADDHPIFRAGFKIFLEGQEDVHYSLVAEASNGIELLEKVKLHRPDIVFTDIKMPEMDGIQACRLIKEKYPLTQIIALTLYQDDRFIWDMIHAGANGYIVKSNPIVEILAAIKSVSAGIAYYSSKIANKLEMDEYKKKTAKQIKFSEQEVKVIRLICKQLTNMEIANTVQLHVRTVEDYRHKIQEKKNAKNAVGIALYALAHGIESLNNL
ncbi:response regulator transcription factor [Ferruginibacter sp.]|uniref:response regulator transcription factor n=1 Tax=Ferruginibacter sp. TaxID=1940288 RepID=UPI002657C8E2|nr:response regulator transcription factor [Ferruginibacter sp.]